jgi:hypothetical protein
VLSPASNKKWLFSVDLETIQLKREYRRKKYTRPAFPYMLPWPPVLNGRKRIKRRRKRRPKRRKNGGARDGSKQSSRVKIIVFDYNIRSLFYYHY